MELAGSQQFGKVHRADWNVGPVQGTLQLHEATGVDRYDNIGAGLLDGLDLGSRHSAGNVRKLHRERTAEATALLGNVHLSQFQPLHVGKQPSWTRLDL